MDSTVQTIWWISLALALLLTVVAAALLIRVVRLCGEILLLARATAPAAEGIARNTSSISSLGAVVTLAPTLLAVAGQIDAAAAKIATTLNAVAPREA